MIRWLRSLLAWRTAFRSGVYTYQENAVTGARRSFRHIAGGYTPLDADWLGNRPARKLTPPRGGSGALR